MSSLCHSLDLVQTICVSTVLIYEVTRMEFLFLVLLSSTISISFVQFAEA